MIVKTLHQIVFCTAEFFDKDYPPSESPSCYAELLPITDQVTSTTTDTPDGVTVPIPRTLCTGDLSFKTVYGQRCKVNNKFLSHLF